MSSPYFQRTDVVRAAAERKLVAELEALVGRAEQDGMPGFRALDVINDRITELYQE